MADQAWHAYSWVTYQCETEQTSSVPLRDGSNAVELFNRYNVRKLEMMGGGLDQIFVDGKFRLTEPEKFVEALEYLGVGHGSQGTESHANSPIQLFRR
jgi:hypothetical protein